MLGLSLCSTVHRHSAAPAGAQWLYSLSVVVATGIQVSGRGSSPAHRLTRKGNPFAILIIGIELAKNVLAVLDIDEGSKPS